MQEQLHKGRNREDPFGGTFHDSFGNGYKIKTLPGDLGSSAIMALGLEKLLSYKIGLRGVSGLRLRP